MAFFLSSIRESSLYVAALDEWYSKAETSYRSPSQPHKIAKK